MSIHKMFVHEFSLEERMKLQLMNEIIWTKLTFPIIGDGSFREWEGRVPSRGKFCQRRVTEIRKEKI